MPESEELRNKAIEHLKKLTEKIDKCAELFGGLKTSVDKAVKEFEELSLPDMTEEESKLMGIIEKIMSHLARANLIAAIAHMQNFCNLTDRISETVDESKEELIEMEKLILIKTEQKEK